MTRRFPALSLRWLVASTAAATALLGACANRENPPSFVNYLRVLSVRATPPEVAPGGTTTLDALVVGTDKPLCVGWSFCAVKGPAEAGLGCLDPALEVELGVEATATFDADPALFQKALGALRGLAVPPAGAQAGSDAGGGDAGTSTGTPPAGLSFDLAKGIPLTIFYTARERLDGETCPTSGLALNHTPCGARSTCLQTYKTLTLSTSPKPNENPVLLGVMLGGVAWPEDVTPTLGPGQTLPIVPLWDKASQQTYTNTFGEVLTEALTFVWFTDRADYDKDRSTETNPARTISFKAPDAPLTSQPVDVWIVAIDGRGGNTWLHRRGLVQVGAKADPSPVCAASPNATGCQMK